MSLPKFLARAVPKDPSPQGLWKSFKGWIQFQGGEMDTMHTSNTVRSRHRTATVLLACSRPCPPCAVHDPRRSRKQRLEAVGVAVSSARVAAATQNPVPGPHQGVRHQLL